MPRWSHTWLPFSTATGIPPPAEARDLLPEFLGAAMRKRVLVGSLCLWFFASWLSGMVWAGDAAVLPKGVFKIDVESKFYLPTTKRFNPDGDLEDIAIDFNTSLDSSIFPGLRQLES